MYLAIYLPSILSVAWAEFLHAIDFFVPSRDRNRDCDSSQKVSRKQKIDLQRRLAEQAACSSFQVEEKGIKEKVMRDNQILDQSLYVSLTRNSLVCVPEVHFLRSVSMKRNLFCRSISLAGFVLPVLVVLAGVPTHAQKTSDVPPGMDERTDPFSNRGPSTFGGKPAAPDKPAVSTSPGEVRGVTRYANGLAMPGAEVVILSANANIDRTMVSGADGTFVFKNLKPGEYQLTARKEGFAISPITKVELAAGKVVAADVPLGASLAASPVSNESVLQSRRASAPAYRVQPASLRVATPEPAADETVPTPATSPGVTSQPTANSAEQPEVSALLDEVRALTKRVEELEAEHKNPAAPDQPAAAEVPAAPAAAPAVTAPQDAAAAAPKLLPGQYVAAGGTATYFKGDTDVPDHPAGFDPFSPTRIGPG